MEGKKWKFMRDGKEEEVALEKWAWEVTYVDGTVLKQFGDDGTFRQFREVEQDRVAEFRLTWTGQGPATTHRLYVKEGMKLFHFYQRHRFQGIGMDLTPTVHVFGCKSPGTAGTYLYVMPSGDVLVGPDGPLDFVGQVLQEQMGIA